MRQVILSGEVLESITDFIREQIEKMREENEKASKSMEAVETESNIWFSYMAIIEVNENKIRQYQEILNHL